MYVWQMPALVKMPNMYELQMPALVKLKCAQQLLSARSQLLATA